ncbi:MAG: aminotransferase class V-fold PLP-dependent enzyme [Acidimicrobiales bacterium]
MIPIDVVRARTETPGCEEVVHFNNAGGSLPPRQVTDAVVGYIEREAKAGGYEQAAIDSDKINCYRSAAASLINADESEIAFAFNDTLAFSSTFRGLAATGAVPPDSVVLVDRAIYVSHYLALLQARQLLNLTIRVIESGSDGALDLESLQALLDERVSFVQLTHIGTHRGVVNPVEEASALIRASTNAIISLDACQSIGQIPIDVQEIGCDVLTATGRKYLRAPRGTGFSFVSNRLIDRVDPPGIDGHSAFWSGDDTYQLLPDARRLESFEASMATKVGLGVALEYALSWGVDAIAERISLLANELLVRLRETGFKVVDSGEARSGIVTFWSDHEDPVATQERLSTSGINTVVIFSKSARMDMDPLGIPAAVRASLHYFNTSEEITILMDTLRAAH